MGKEPSKAELKRRLVLVYDELLLLAETIEARLPAQDGQAHASLRRAKRDIGDILIAISANLDRTSE